MGDWLLSIFEDSCFRRAWKPISRPAIAAWLVFYVTFLIYAFGKSPASLFIHNANLVVHEGGHNLFGWFGPTLGLWGGTLLQWLVPFLLAVYFFTDRQVAGFVFCLFFFFENWIDTAEYMADARAQVLPLVTTGDPDLAEHDFFRIFNDLGVLPYDTRIAAVVRILGWCGMIGCVAWFVLRFWARSEPSPLPAPFPKPAISLIERYPGKARAATASGAASGQTQGTATSGQTIDRDNQQSSINNQQSPKASNPQ